MEETEDTASNQKNGKQSGFSRGCQALCRFQSNFIEPLFVIISLALVNIAGAVLFVQSASPQIMNTLNIDPQQAHLADPNLMQLLAKKVKSLS